MLDVRNLSFSYATAHGAFPVLDDVSFQVERGSSFGIVGESGSGKSTLLRLLAGLSRPAGGSVLVDGAGVGAWTPDLRRSIQYVMQDPYASLHPLKTIHSALSEPLRIHRFDRIDERVEQALLGVGLDRSYRFRFPHQLSGGQRQRVAIARALIIEPSIVLLDEPTSALDVSIQAEVLNLLKELQAERGLTYVLVSHDLAVVAHMCRQIVILRSGVVVETIDADALRRNACSHPYTRELVASAAIGLDAIEEQP
jgi:peptide/nickel transport system ATP-binding protein